MKTFFYMLLYMNTIDLIKPVKYLNNKQKANISIINKIKSGNYTNKFPIIIFVFFPKNHL
jgi:hypothetical protein